MKWRRPRPERARAGPGRLAPVLLAALAAGGCEGAVPSAPADDEGEGVVGAWVRSGGRVRTYQLFEPTGVTGPAPLVVVLHGSGGDGSEIRFVTRLDAPAADRGAFVAYPDGVERSWAAGCACTPAEGLGVDDVRFFRTLVAHVVSARPVDPGRVFVAGFSQGSMMAQRLACEAADLVVGLAGVGAGMPRRLQPACAPARPVSVVLMHGRLDPIVPWSGNGVLGGARTTADWWAGANGCGASTHAPGPDVAEDGTTIRILSWADCARSSRVRLYDIEGGGHTWPGSTAPFGTGVGRTSHDIDASDEILAFFLEEGS